MIENISEGQAKDMILKYCVDNGSLISSEELKRNLFPEFDIDIINLLIDKIDQSYDNVAETRSNKRTSYIRATGITSAFLKQGGYAQSELNNEIELQKNLERENLELEKTKVDLKLAKETLKEFPRTKWFARIGFIIGIILLLKELYVILKPQQ